MPAAMTLLEAVNDPNLFAPHFADRETWQPWWVFCKALYGINLDCEELVLFEQCTGRKLSPTERAREAWLAIGRRGGKSRILALIAAYEALFGDWPKYLSAGEKGYIVIIAADRKQCRTILQYVHAFLKGAKGIDDNFVGEIENEGIEVGGNLIIEVATSSYRTVRGRTIVLALCDEAAFWAAEDGSNPASEVIKALRPAMATIPSAMLLVASSPWAKRGPLYDAFQKHYGKDGQILIWNAPTWVMNPSLPRDHPTIAAEYEEDEISASVEYGGEFRNDIDGYVTRELVESLIEAGVIVRPYAKGKTYVAFVDPSGGANDSMAMAIAHMDDRTAVLDWMKEWRPPYSPAAVVDECVSVLRGYGCTSVRGDYYGVEWVQEPFRKQGIGYTKSAFVKSEIFREALPMMNSGRAMLLDNSRLVGQLISLERKVAGGGRETITKPKHGNFHDDLANAAMGALVHASMRKPQEIPVVAPIILTWARPSESNH